MKCPLCERANPPDRLQCSCGYRLPLPDDSPGRGRGESAVRSRLTIVGVWLTALAFVAIVGRVALAPLREEGLGFLLVALLDLASLVFLPAGVSCWIIGALRDRKVRQEVAGR